MRMNVLSISLLSIFLVSFCSSVICSSSSESSGYSSCKYSSRKLIKASKIGDHKAVKRILKKDENEVCAKDNSGKTALMYASENGHYKVVKCLCRYKRIDVNAKISWVKLR